jgi:hypothetical protein
MPDESPSLQDVLRHRRRAGFVGRRGELDLFDANFTAALDRKHFLFNVYGEGGVGKSSLLEQWRGIAARHGALVAQVDEGVYGVPEAMASIADRLGTRFDDFRKSYRTYQKARQQLERDPRTKDRWSRLTRTAVKGGLNLSKALPGAAPVVDLVNRDATATAVDDVRQFLREELRSRRQVAVMESPAGRARVRGAGGAVPAARARRRGRSRRAAGRGDRGLTPSAEEQVGVGGQGLEVAGGVGHETAGAEVEEAADGGDLGGPGAVGLGHVLDHPEGLALRVLESAAHVDLVAAAQLPQVPDGGFQGDRADAGGEQGFLGDAGGAQALPAGMLPVLKIDGLVEVALGVQLVAADRDADLERFCHDGHVTRQ